MIISIRNKDHQIELEGTIPWIDDLRIKDVFKDEDKKKGAGVIDLMNRLVKILRLEAKEPRDDIQWMFALVEPWDKG